MKRFSHYWAILAICNGQYIADLARPTPAPGSSIPVSG